MARHLILVVDDEDNLRDVLVEVLKRDGHEVDSAVDGAEGLRRAEERRYDLVVTDLRMPGLEGRSCTGPCASATRIARPASSS